MFPLGNKPIIHYVVEEVVAAGLKEVIIVINKDKEIIRKYFENETLEEELRGRGKGDVLEELDALRKKINIKYVYQEEQKGIGHALLCARDDLTTDFAVLLGDSVLKATVPCIAQLRKQYESLGGSVINIEHARPEEVPSRGMVEGVKIKKGVFRVTRLVEKPKKFSTDLAICARYFLTKNIMNYLMTQKEGINNEIQLTDAITKLAEKEKVYAFLSKSKRYDIGNPSSYYEAIKSFRSK
jgi:UTP--glucose-1-phosphate uridylyltransferase